MFGGFVDVDHCKLPMYDWLLKLYKRHYKSHFVANSILNGKKRYSKFLSCIACSSQTRV